MTSANDRIWVWRNAHDQPQLALLKPPVEATEYMRVLEGSQISCLILAAARWAAFQETDSLIDQDGDLSLRTEAGQAHEELLHAVSELELAR